MRDEYKNIIERIRTLDKNFKPDGEAPHKPMKFFDKKSLAATIIGNKGKKDATPGGGASTLESVYGIGNRKDLSADQLQKMHGVMETLVCSKGVPRDFPKSKGLLNRIIDHILRLGRREDKNQRGGVAPTAAPKDLDLEICKLTPANFTHKGLDMYEDALLSYIVAFCGDENVVRTYLDLCRTHGGEYVQKAAAKADRETEVWEKTFVFLSYLRFYFDHTFAISSDDVSACQRQGCKAALVSWNFSGRCNEEL